jgi:hypothetical protein
MVFLRADSEVFLGPWRGAKENREGYWLRWWDEGEVILPWAVEKVAGIQEQAALEKQRADEAQERDRP